MIADKGCSAVSCNISESLNKRIRKAKLSLLLLEAVPQVASKMQLYCCVRAYVQRYAVSRAEQYLRNS